MKIVYGDMLLRSNDHEVLKQSDRPYYRNEQLSADLLEVKLKWQERQPDPE
jgi:hypothetical protein